MGGSMSTLTHNSSNSYCPRDGGATNDLVKPIENGHSVTNGSAVAHNGNIREHGVESARTAFDLVMCGFRLAETGPCLGTRQSASSPYVYTTYKETMQEVKSVAAYLSRVLNLAKGDFVGTLSSNCANLAVLELACYSLGVVIVPLYDTLGREACRHILEETRLRVVFCRSVKQLETIKELATELGFTADTGLRVILSETDASAASSQPMSSSVSVDSFADALAKGGEAAAAAEAAAATAEAAAAAAAAAANPSDSAPASVEPGDLAVICYTSGTTGRPKGVMLTNTNLVKGVLLVRASIKDGAYGYPMELTPADVYFSYLPMAHILERMCQLFAFGHGVSIGFFRGDRATFMDDLRDCHPTFIAAVPKVLSRVRERAMAAVAGSRFKSAVMQTALNRKSRRLASMRIDRGTLWDRLVFRKVQEALGDRVRFVAVGGAPISPETLQFVKVAFGCPVVQGFGQTETSGLGLCQRPGDPSCDNTGQPMLGVEVKLVDAPEADCIVGASADGDNVRGELCIRGPTCFAGYYCQPERTAETIDAEGWVHTGDIAQRLPGGSYRIVDRVKHLFKLAQGEYIAPEKIELAYCLCPMVDQVFVDGRSERSCLLGVVVPALDAAKAWMAKSGGSSGNGVSAEVALASPRQILEAACASAEFKAQLLAAMTQTGRQKGLQGFEQVKEILLHAEPFSPENDLMTPTLKMKRPQLRKKFAEAFDSMYLQVDP